MDKKSFKTTLKLFYIPSSFINHIIIQRKSVLKKYIVGNDKISYN